MLIKYDCDYLINNINLLNNIYNEEQQSFYCDYIEKKCIFKNNELPLWLHNISKIGSHAFSDCEDLTNIIIPNGVTEIGSYAFSSCDNLTNVIMPNSVTHIGFCAFSSCSSLTNVTIPESVTHIENHAFDSCTNLDNIKIPSNVTYIGSGVFQTCRKLTTIYLHPTTPPTLHGVSAISTATTKIYVPVGSGDAYKNATNWSAFADIIFENEDIVIE